MGKDQAPNREENRGPRLTCPAFLFPINSLPVANQEKACLLLPNRNKDISRSWSTDVEIFARSDGKWRS
jgi:hypothetical protein